ncbi:MAG: ABC transporter ATP-binding protein [Mycobacteriales bacterium]
MTALVARLAVARDGFRLDAALDAAAGEVVALLGPNGAGKTTALRALAGLVPLTGGRIGLEGTVLDDPAGRVWVPPERRPVGVVFQDYLLFPHLTALDNVAFGPRCHGADRRAARTVAAEWLARVGLAEYTRARPRALSGGQAQRVALARALAVRPRLLLLDEPLAALDAHTRTDVRGELRRHLAGHDGVTVLVTHDPLDAMMLADRIVVLEGGAVTQTGEPADITRHPRSEYAARLAGLNLYRGEGRGGTLLLAGGFALAVGEPVRGEAFVAFPPSAVALYRTRPDGSPRNTWLATVAGLDRHGDHLRVQLTGPLDAAADITPTAAAELRLAPGDRIWAAVKAHQTHAYPT